MSDNQFKSLLKDEYLHVSGVIESFDARVVTIKAWSISFSLAAMAAAFASHAKVILLVSAFSALLFWLIEGMWKTFQNAFYPRINEIEKYFRGESDEIKLMQANASWIKHWRNGGMRKLLQIMFWPHVFLPHIVVFLCGVVLYILVLAGCLSI